MGDDQDGGTATPTNSAAALTAALDLVDRALASQDRAEAALREAAVAGTPGADLARRLGQAAQEFARCRQVWPLVPLPGEAADLRAGVDAVLHHHQEMVEQAMLLLYRPARPGTERVRRGYADGLGEPALTLMAARRRIKTLRDASLRPAAGPLGS